MNIALFDADGSESLTSITIQMPSGLVPTHTELGGATVTDLGMGQYQIVGTASAMQATLDTFAVTPPLHSDDNLTIAVSAATLDADSSTNSVTSNITLRVQAVGR
ncbi:MAG: hypothetical protein U5K75_11770 [Ahrensia sp.]|nr:hypothetical protein [Ahrensia sp.]